MYYQRWITFPGYIFVRRLYFVHFMFTTSWVSATWYCYNFEQNFNYSSRIWNHYSDLVTSFFNIFEVTYAIASHIVHSISLLRHVIYLKYLFWFCYWKQTLLRFLSAIIKIFSGKKKYHGPILLKTITKSSLPKNTQASSFWKFSYLLILSLHKLVVEQKRYNT